MGSGAGRAVARIGDDKCETFGLSRVGAHRVGSAAAQRGSGAFPGLVDGL